MWLQLPGLTFGRLGGGGKAAASPPPCCSWIHCSSIGGPGNQELSGPISPFWRHMGHNVGGAGAPHLSRSSGAHLWASALGLQVGADWPLVWAPVLCSCSLGLYPPVNGASGSFLPLLLLPSRAQFVSRLASVE